MIGLYFSCRHVAVGTEQQINSFFFFGFLSEQRIKFVFISISRSSSNGLRFFSSPAGSSSYCRVGQAFLENLVLDEVIDDENGFVSNNYRFKLQYRDQGSDYWLGRVQGPSFVSVASHIHYHGELDYTQYSDIVVVDQSAPSRRHHCAVRQQHIQVGYRRNQL